MSTILTEIILGIQERARWRRYERFVIVVSVLLSTTNSSTWRGDSFGDPSYESKTY